MSDERYHYARDLVDAAREKKMVETRCLAAFDEFGHAAISNQEMIKLAADVLRSIEVFVESGEAFEALIAEKGIADLLESNEPA